MPSGLLGWFQCRAHSWFRPTPGQLVTAQKRESHRHPAPLMAFKCDYLEPQEVGVSDHELCPYEDSQKAVLCARKTSDHVLSAAVSY